MQNGQRKFSSPFNLLKVNNQVFKTDFQDIGFNVRSVDDWMDIIHYIQNQSNVREIKRGRITLYELENSMINKSGKIISDVEINELSNEEKELIRKYRAKI